MPLIPDSTTETRLTRGFDGREPPARRLGILYISSLTAVAALSGVSLEFALREVNWQSVTLRSISRAARESSLERGLSLPALAILSVESADSRLGHINSLRAQITHAGVNPQCVALRAAARELGDAEHPGINLAESHLRAAHIAAEKLLKVLKPDPGATPTTASLSPIVRVITEESAAFHTACQHALEDMEQSAAGHVDRLRWREWRLFAFVMVVLLLEGLFVISPAVAKLQQVIGEMERTQCELRTYAGKLERSNRDLQDFASVASHDLQEPLRKVQAFSDRLLTKYQGVLDEQGREYLDRVQNAARRMQSLINDLLTYARITTKAVPFVSVDLTEATRDVLSDLEVRIERTGGRVEISPLPTIEGDPIQVRQLMQNLIGNSLKYHQAQVPPVVKVYRGTPAPEREGICELVVEDNGIGFEEEYAERIFGIFQRLHGRSEYEGTGVGLAVCRKIAERHGGTVTARGFPGVGSKFTVALPIRQPRGESPDGRAV